MTYLQGTQVSEEASFIKFYRLELKTKNYSLTQPKLVRLFILRWLKCSKAWESELGQLANSSVGKFVHLVHIATRFRDKSVVVYEMIIIITRAVKDPVPPIGK